MNNIKYRLIIDKGDELKDIEGIYSSTSLEEEIERQSKLNEIVKQSTEITVILKVKPFLKAKVEEDLPRAKFYTEDIEEYYDEETVSEEWYQKKEGIKDERKELDTEKPNEDMDIYEEGETSESEAGEE